MDIHEIIKECEEFSEKYNLKNVQLVDSLSFMYPILSRKERDRVIFKAVLIDIVAGGQPVRYWTLQIYSHSSRIDTWAGNITFDPKRRQFRARARGRNGFWQEYTKNCSSLREALDYIGTCYTVSRF